MCKQVSVAGSHQGRQPGVGVQGAAGLPTLVTDYCATWPAIPCGEPAAQAANKVQPAALRPGSCLWAGLHLQLSCQAMVEMSDPPAFSQQARLQSLQRAWWGLVKGTEQQQEACTLPRGSLAPTEQKGNRGKNPRRHCRCQYTEGGGGHHSPGQCFHMGQRHYVGKCPDQQILCTACSVAFCLNSYA